MMVCPPVDPEEDRLRARIGAYVTVLVLVGCVAGTHATSHPWTQGVRVTATVFFRADDGLHGAELWKTDGTAAGTVMVKDIAPGRRSSSASSFTVVGTTLFFYAYEPKHGGELWASDGTTEGTKLVKDILPGPDSSGPGSFTDVDGTLFFYAYDPTHGRELWKSDGTAAGTVFVEDVVPGERSSGPSGLAAWKDSLYFGVYDRDVGHELWRSDGTRAGTRLVKVVVARPRWKPTYWLDLTVAGDRLFLRGYDPAHGFELWVSDGASSGTGIVSDLQPGSESSYPMWLTALGGILYFRAFGSGVGPLWRSDGTEAGTIVLDDQPSLRIDDLTAIGDALFFVERRRARQRALDERRNRPRHAADRGRPPRLRRIVPAGAHGRGGCRVLRGARRHARVRAVEDGRDGARNLPGG
jgi:ELWxxDGT repeat protein